LIAAGLHDVSEPARLSREALALFSLFIALACDAIATAGRIVEAARALQSVRFG
jgi:hypothetical protein